MLALGLQHCFSEDGLTWLLLRLGQVDLTLLGLLAGCELVVWTTCELVQIMVTRDELASGELVGSQLIDFILHYTGLGEVLYRD